MSGTLWSLQPPGEQAVEPDRDEPARTANGRVRNASANRLHCSFCQTELADEVELTIPASGAQGRRVTSRSFCSTYCRDCVLALAALHPSPLATSDFIAKRELLTDRLLELWRHRQGPDPALVRQAADSASRGLAIADAV